MTIVRRKEILNRWQRYLLGGVVMAVFARSGSGRGGQEALQ